MQYKKINNTLGAEKMLLSVFVKSPNRIFDVDNVILNSNDFSNTITKCIYCAIKDIAESKGRVNNSSLDLVILQERVAGLFPTIYASNSNNFETAIQSIVTSVPSDNWIEYARIIMTDSVKRKIKSTITDINNDLDKMSDAKEIVATTEAKIFDATNTLFKYDDLVVLGENFDEYLNERQIEVDEGQLNPGLSSGFTIYDDCIGGGFRDGSVNVIAGRAKAGKSIVAINAGLNVALQNIPVVYLDTELDRTKQNIRLCSAMTGIPMRRIETMTFRSNQEQVNKIMEAKDLMKKLPIHYIDIKGWSIEQQISIIRRFFSKVVGKNNKTGRFNKGLVILDYIKLMNAADLGNLQEYQSLGYRISAYKDLMKSYENPMLLLAQRNREGLSTHNESSIAGSDRISHFCDNLSIFYMKDEAELSKSFDKQKEDSNYKFSNCKLKVLLSRDGGGSDGDEYIGLDCQFKPPRPLAERNARIIECGLEKSFEGE